MVDQRYPKVEQMELRDGDWTTLKDLAAPIRYRVFVEEQQVAPELEWDGRDPDCLHVVALREGRPVGTARLLPNGHIGRMAVLPQWRGHGTGRCIMERMLRLAHDHGHREVVLAAQLHALAFYRKLGFKAFGEPFQDAGIAHRLMRRELP